MKNILYLLKQSGTQVPINTTKTAVELNWLGILVIGIIIGSILTISIIGLIKSLKNDIKDNDKDNNNDKN